MQEKPTFADFGLKPELLSTLTDIGFSTPTTIQEKTIPILLEAPTDLVGLAHTGTGKTAAFGLPILQRLYLEEPSIQGLIVCPTRELCLQVATEIERYGKNMPGLIVTSVYGGVNISLQVRALRKGCHILVATPGRLLDLLRQNKVELGAVEFMVLDEADKMLEMGFIDDVEDIISQCNPDKYLWMFSATMAPEIRRIADRFMRDPVEVSAGEGQRSAENVAHHYYLCHGSNRLEVLQRIIDQTPEIYGIVFTRTRAEAQDLAESLMKNGYNADALHGELQQQQRDRVMKMFRERTLQILVATDVAARGLDVDDLTHVIHYSLPDDRDTYIHRSGRTGRAGKAGISVVILTPGERNRMQQLSRSLKREFDKKHIPNPDEIVAQRMSDYLNRFKELQYNEVVIQTFLPEFVEALEIMDKEELIKRLCWQELNRFYEYYKNGTDLNVADRPANPNNRRDRDNAPSYGDRNGDRNNDRNGGRTFGAKNGQNGRPAKFNGGGPSERYQRFLVNVGMKDGMNKMDFLNWVSRESRLAKTHIHRVDVQRDCSYFESFKDEASTILQRLSGATFHNRIVEVNYTGGNGDGGGGGEAYGDNGNGDGRRAYAQQPRDNGYDVEDYGARRGAQKKRFVRK